MIPALAVIPLFAPVIYLAAAFIALSIFVHGIFDRVFVTGLALALAGCILAFAQL